ncbi:unnamed protein product [Blepharisma stoltei]|uniref:Uncharacterized protein n=1 Tax=Blepharisma stoltei TaxID=1481888 RepID=A0AAU9IN08_9CILI|nr:unnamed protein product [Blepharisma stoltei]
MNKDQNASNSDIERILSSQVWKRRSLTMRTTASEIHRKLRIDCSKTSICNNTLSTPSLPPIKESFLNKLKSATLPPLSPSDLSFSPDHSKRLFRLAIPYKTLASSLKSQIRTIKTNTESIRVPVFPKAPFGSHKNEVVPEFEELTFDYTNIHDIELKANQIKCLSGRMKSEGLFANLLAKSADLK